MGTKMLALGELSTDKIAQLDRGNQIVLWPVASLEQHGPHLPLGTDAIILNDIVEGVRERLGEDFSGFVLPQMSFGKSPEHLGFPGTVSMQATTLLAVADDMVASLAKHQFTTFVFLNGHGGNSALLQAASFDLRYKYGVKIYCVDLWTGNGFDALLKQAFPKLNDSEVHAASLETSVMLFLHPGLVGKIPSGNAANNLLGTDPWGWSSQDFGENGIIGDPSHASAQSGEALYNYAVNRICEMLRDLSGRLLHEHA